jgi:hypothetical protein
MKRRMSRIKSKSRMGALDFPTFGGRSEGQHNGCLEEQPWEDEGFRGS